MPTYYQVPRFCGIYYIPSTTIVPPVPSWLPQLSLSSLTKLHHTASSTTITQTFVNPSSDSAISQAKYNFPLYESCAVVSFRCYVGKRLIEGIVKEKEEAKTEYKQAVARGETAGLLEQHTPDVFSTSLGNIPAGETVRVEIEYILELKHDAEIDGLRFTIPTSIAPRYGNAPSGLDLGAPSAGKNVIGDNGMSIAVEITMPSNIRTVQSPSHTIAMHLGGHVQDVEESSFDPKCALATLSQTTAELGSDFILLIKCADLATPRALLETHPTIPGSKALMVTLVPKFKPPPGPKPEIVFIADRSGSMEDRVPALKSALRVFLKSLPLGVKFNICSFGSQHTFLWPKSRAYSAESLEEAQNHVETMDAEYGGTELLPPIVSTVERRYADIPLEIMVLTDGEVWSPEAIYAYIRGVTSKGDVRLFTLGIGEDVSHSLVEGMARAGRGFAQIVADEKEGLGGKVVRMLKAGLGAHVNDYVLDWPGKPTEEVAKVAASSTPSAPKEKINLFDTNAPVTEDPITFTPLPEFVVPNELQAPYKIPSLFPFSRTTAYILFSDPSCAPPASVMLRGTTPDGTELELEIPVQKLPQKARTIHQLAARKILQELEEGTGYIHSGKYGVDPASGTFEDWVKREGVRVGLKYGLASEWTSFLAVQKTKKEGDTLQDLEKREKPEGGEKEEELAKMDIDEEGGTDDFELLEFESQESRSLSESNPQGAARTKVTYRKSTQSSNVQYLFLDLPATGASSPPGGAVPAPSLPPPRALLIRPQVLSSSSASPAFSPSSPAYSPTSPTYSPTSPARGGARRYRKVLDLDDSEDSKSEDEDGSPMPAPSLPPPPAPLIQTQALPAHSASPAFSTSSRAHGTVSRGRGTTPLGRGGAARHRKIYDGSPPPSARSSNRGEIAVVEPSTPHDHTMALIALQTFEGSFPLTPALVKLLGLDLGFVETKLSACSLTLREEIKKSLLATLLTVGMLEGKLAEERDVWDLVVEKARSWVEEMSGVLGAAVLETLQKLAEELLQTCA